MIAATTQYADMAMLPEFQRALEDEKCPVADDFLGDMYRASADGLRELIATVSPTARAMLAVYCYRRAHLASIGMVIAGSCEKEDLSAVGGNMGASLFDRSREASALSLLDPRPNGRRKVTLSSGSLRQLDFSEEHER
jgi:hypothetical protein